MSCICVWVTVRFSLHIAYVLLYVKYDFIEQVAGLSVYCHPIKATYPNILGCIFVRVSVSVCVCVCVFVRGRSFFTPHTRPDEF